MNNITIIIVLTLQTLLLTELFIILYFAYKIYKSVTPEKKKTIKEIIDWSLKIK